MKKLRLLTILMTLSTGALAQPVAGALTADGFPREMTARPSSGPLGGGQYVIDPTHTFVMYEIGHYGASTNRGRFSTREGSVQIESAGKSGRVEITMDISSINTGVDLLNRHIQSKDFFNVAEFPTGRFVSDRFDIAADGVVDVPGTLTLLGRSRPVTLKARRFKCYENPMMNRQVCGGDFETTVRRSDWGITWGISFGFEDAVKLLVQVEAVHVK